MLRASNSERGFALGAVMLIVLVLIATSGAIFALSTLNAIRLFRIARFQSSLAIIQANIYAVVENSTAMQNMANGNGTMNCVKNGTDCSPGNYDLVLYNPSGAVIYNNGIATHGWDETGNICTAYNAAKVINRCSIKVSIQWSPFCNGVPCKIPPEKMMVFLSYTTPTADPSGQTISKYYLPFNLGRQDGGIPFFSAYR